MSSRKPAIDTPNPQAEMLQSTPQAKNTIYISVFVGGLGPKGGLNHTMKQHFSAPKVPKFFGKIVVFWSKIALFSTFSMIFINFQSK